MAADRSADRFITVTAACIFLLIGMHYVVNAQRECEQPDLHTQPQGQVTIYKVAYNLNYSSTDRECMVITDDKSDPTIERGVFRFKIDNIVDEGKGHLVTYQDGSRVFIGDPKREKDPVPIHFDQLSSGVTLVYICEGSLQSILVMYPFTSNLESEATAAAAQLTETTERFKMKWNNCTYYM